MKLLAVTLAAAALVQHVEVYRARHRPAAELAAVVEPLLGAGGRVAVDGRTAAIVVSGTRADVRRVLALLAELDRPLRTVVIEHAWEETEELRAAGVAVEWTAGRGALRVGTLVPAVGDGPLVSGGVARSSGSRAFEARLRILEGEPGWLLTGVSRFVPGPFPVEQRAESGFEAVATVLDSGRIHVELRPFDGRLEGGGVRYTAAASAVEVEPGETVAVAATRTSGDRTAVELPGGAARDSARSERVLLLRVDLEP